MPQNIMPMAKLLSRRMLPLMSPREKARVDCKPLRLVSSGRIEKVSPLTTWKSFRRLSPGESQLAEALANIKGNYQRPDKELIEAMRKKQRFRTSPVEQAELPAEHFQPSSTAVDPDHSIVAERAPVTKPIDIQATIASTLEPPKRIEDWEEKAKNIIDQESLNLDRGWSKITWKQKASNVVRLKLLKDDGYDIAHLQAKGISADQIIGALLAHVHTRTQPAPVHNVLPALNTDAQSESISDLKKNEVSDTQDEESLAVPSNEEMYVASIPQGSDSAKPKIVKPGPEVSPDDRAYPTVLMIGQKRKHGHHDDDQPEWHERRPQAHLHKIYNKIRLQRDSFSADELENPSCTCGLSSPKRPRLATPDEVRTTIEHQAHDLTKGRISRKIFKSSRAARKEFQVHQKDGKSSSAPKLVFTPEKPQKPARIIFAQHSNPATEPTGADVYMGSVGSDLIEAEIKCLSSRLDEYGRYCIHDPESGEDMEGDLLMEYSGPLYRAFRHDIRLNSGEHAPTTIQSHPRALISLIEHLRKEDLQHLCRYRSIDIEEDVHGERDVEMKVLRNDSIPFHLSEAVCSILEKVQMLLEEGQDVGGDEIRVGVVPQPAMFRVY